MKFAVFEGEKFRALCESRPMVKDRIYLIGDSDNYYRWEDLKKGYQVYALLVNLENRPTLTDLIQQGYILPMQPFAVPEFGRCTQVDLSPEALTAAVWNGEGLPPVGCECEYSPFRDSWHPVKVFALKPNANGSTSALFERDKGWGACADPKCFRPLRTAEQLAAEKRDREIAEIMRDAGIQESAFKDDPEAVVWAGSLWAKGYRKPDA